MSDAAYRKSVKRKTHKERSQPGDRQKYGLLEKKKDYLERARDFHKKERTIQKLKVKASERNPDEFYFAMENAKTKDGIHDGRRTEANKYSQDELRLMKTQDAKYLALKAQQDAKKVERMQASLHMIGAAAPNSHIVFVDSVHDAKKFDPATHFDTVPELMDRTFNRPRKSQLEAGPLVVSTNPENAVKIARRMEKKTATAYSEMAQRAERRDKMLGLARKMEFGKTLMGKGHRVKLKGGAGAEAEGDAQGGGQAAFRWKKQRRR